MTLYDPAAFTACRWCSPATTSPRCSSPRSIGNGIRLADGDILVVCQKVVSKAEGRLVDLRTVTPSPFALQLAAQTDGKDPRVVEVILRETTRIVRMDAGHLIVETGPGWVCANAGVDESNSGDPNLVILLPDRPRRLGAPPRRRRAGALRRARSRVIVTDTFGRPWRQGLVDFALGVAGMPALLDLRGSTDLDGRVLKHTVGRAGRRAGRRRRPGDAQGRRHPRRAGARLRVHARRGLGPRAHPREAVRSVPLTRTWSRRSRARTMLAASPSASRALTR